MAYKISAVPIEVNGSEMNVVVAANDSSCTNTTCKFDFKISTEMSVPSYSMVITARNILSDGYSENKTCSGTPISKRRKGKF